ncbi:hypothetical protein [Marinibacterium profundimaris]|uniref:Lipoprotein n=1 Tax=Marinibacterium profundimaris TaxID=1679460 RepID=A0A225NH53_9RHOB|nr:hypothetical protein [Marinibacterium profundimaris]OWU71762.1 hypothetical protein ATO3_18005 [Marinibacterium profundimaris]
MRRVPILLLGLLAACDAPSPYFAGQPVTRVAVDGSVFDVRIRGDLAESVRISPEYAPRLGPIGGRAALAMEQASGCHVRRLLGDQALQLGQLTCDDDRRQAPVLRPTPQYDCLETPSGVYREDGLEYLDYDCAPY